jgi:hypothetical protein
MAQRTIHYLFGEMISKEIKLADKKRFLLGSILPDAIEPACRNASHFKIKTATHKYFDFEAFRNEYFNLMLHDDLYLGYYMHLVEDAFYRAFFYNNRFTMPRTREEVPILHNDYHILNSYIIQKYGIQNILGSTFSLEREPLCHIAPFTIDKFLGEMAYDFTEQTKGTTVFLTESMLDEYVNTYIPLAIAEVNRIKNRGSSLNATDYAWPAKR